MSVSEPTRRAYDPAITDAMGDAGHPLSVESDGVRWTFGFPTQAAKDRLEKLVFGEEKRIVLAQEDILTPAKFEARVDRLAAQSNERQFATGGPLWLKHAVGPGGMVLWVQSLLMEHHPRVTKEEAVKLIGENRHEVKLTLSVIVPPFFAWALGLADQMAGRLEAGGVSQASEVRERLAAVRAALPALLAHLTPTA